MLVYDETQLREPNLLVPGKKPIGPVKLATGNQLVGYDFVEGQTFQNSILQKIQHKKLETESGAATLDYGVVTGSPTIGVLGGRKALILSQSNGDDVVLGYSETNYWDWVEVQGFNTSGWKDLTFALQFYVSALPSGDEMCIVGPSNSQGSNTSIYLYITPAGNLFATYGAWNGTNLLSETAKTDHWYTYVYTLSADGKTLKVWIDGQYKGAAVVGSATTTPADLAFGKTFSTSYGMSLNGGIGGWWYFRKALPDALARSLSADFWQIVEAA